MKRLSCNNCPACDYINEQLKIDISESSDQWILGDDLQDEGLFEAFLHDEYSADLRLVNKGLK